MQYKHEYGQELEKLIKRASQNVDMLHEFLFDLLSPTEYKDLAVRWQIVKLLEQGVSQRDIAKKLKVSIATVTRGSREMINKKGGFRKILNSQKKKTA